MKVNHRLLSFNRANLECIGLIFSKAKNIKNDERLGYAGPQVIKPAFSEGDLSFRDKLHRGHFLSTKIEFSLPNFTPTRPDQKCTNSHLTASCKHYASTARLPTLAGGWLSKLKII